MTFERDGFTLVPALLSPSACVKAASQISLADPSSGGTRCLLTQPWCAALATMLRAHPALALRGVIGNGDAVAARQATQELSCTARAGDVLVLRPLLLHASSKSSGTSKRRVLHFVFGPRDLPYALAWSNVL
ncbi:MAG TPA: hypothetical protein VGC21_12465 [Telluria sp.]